MRLTRALWRPRFATQALLAQVAVLLLVVASGFVLIALLLREELERQYGERALTIARAVATDPTVVRAVATQQLVPQVQTRAEAVRDRTGALFISVSDARGVRYAHIDPTHVGRTGQVTADVLSGREVMAIEHGTLGTSARGRVPLRDNAGDVVGEVVVGISADAIHDRLIELLRNAGLFTAGTLLLGMAGAAALTRQLKRHTLGLEPWDLTDLLREREAVLHGIGEGVLAVDHDGRVTVCNDAAARLMGRAVASGTHVADADLPAELRSLLAEDREARGLTTTTEDHIVTVSVAPVTRGDRNLGRVLTMRDRTEVDQMARELDVVRALSDALRAQAHEYTNRLHTLYGLLSLGHEGEAQDYLRELMDDPLATEQGVAARLRDPYLRGLLAAKNAVAAERGVQLRLTDESFLPGRLTAPLDVVTILGNMVDNAVSAAIRSRRRPAWVEVTLVTRDDLLEVVVVDSGDGVPAAMAGQLFEPGTTTKLDPDRPHGIGLTLARQLARRHGGNLELRLARGAESGAVFTATMHGVVDRSDEWDQDAAPIVEHRAATAAQEAP